VNRQSTTGPRPLAGWGWIFLAGWLALLAGSPAVVQAARTRSRAPKIVFIAGAKSHGPGDHEYERGSRLLARALETSPSLRDVRTEVHLNGWPLDPRTLDDADAIVMYSDGSDHGEVNHPLLQGDRLAALRRAMQRGAGLVLLHYSVFVPSKRGGPELLDWAGGYFDYESGAGRPPWYSKIQTAATTVVPASPRHPISRGLQPFPLRDEFYYNMRFREPDPRRTPILTTQLPNEAAPQTIAWAVQRADGGRGFVYTGGHFHANWEVDSLRKLVLNGIVWSAGRELPPTGIESSLSAENDGDLSAHDSADWPNVGNDKGAMRYSPLRQINRDSVRNLKVAWIYHTGDHDPAANTTIECTPIVVDGVMYLTTAQIKIVALDAATGRELWKYDPKTRGVNRGVAYWSDGKPAGERRILSALPDGRFISLDARTGRLDPQFGQGGVVDMRAGLDRDITGLNYGSTSAPAVFEDLAMVGIINSEGQPGAPGDIRAFNVRTGKEAWRFHTVPRPGEFGHDTWAGESWKDRSGVNPWSGFTVDAARGILFCGTGSAASDFYGGDRKGQNLFANSTLALNARTGKRIWHFQTIHHDLWDHDLPYPPVLVRVKHDGVELDAAAQVTKAGVLFLFGRTTGKPLFPVEERPVPASDVPGEEAWPTQPFPLKPPPFSRQTLTEDDLTDFTIAANADARAKFRKFRTGRNFTPPSVRGTVTIPGFHGGATWSGASFDPTTGLLYVNSNNVPNINTLLAPPPERPDAFNYTGYNRFLDLEGYPAIKPPWGNLTAIDLNRGEFAWQIVLGEVPALTARGIPPTGTENFGGAIVTAGGLVFIGGTQDEKFHAFDKKTGELLWEYKLDAGGYATPSTYAVDGRQYVVIAAGGGGKLTTRSGDAFVAFALPRKK